MGDIAPNDLLRGLLANAQNMGQGQGQGQGQRQQMGGQAGGWGQQQQHQQARPAASWDGDSVVTNQPSEWQQFMQRRGTHDQFSQQQQHRGSQEQLSHQLQQQQAALQQQVVQQQQAQHQQHQQQQQQQLRQQLAQLQQLQQQQQQQQQQRQMQEQMQMQRMQMQQQQQHHHHHQQHRQFQQPQQQFGRNTKRRLVPNAPPPPALPSHLTDSASQPKGPEGLKGAAASTQPSQSPAQESGAQAPPSPAGKVAPTASIPLTSPGKGSITGSKHPLSSLPPPAKRSKGVLPPPIPSSAASHLPPPVPGIGTKGLPPPPPPGGAKPGLPQIVPAKGMVGGVKGVVEGVKGLGVKSKLSKTPATGGTYKIGTKDKTLTQGVNHIIQQLGWERAFIHEGLRRWVVRKVLAAGEVLPVHKLENELRGDEMNYKLLCEIYQGGVLELANEYIDTFKVGTQGVSVEGAAAGTGHSPEQEDEARRVKRKERDTRLKEQWVKDDVGKTDRQKQALGGERVRNMAKMHSADVEEDKKTKAARLKQSGYLTERELKDLLEMPNGVLATLGQLEKIVSEIIAGRYPKDRFAERKVQILRAAATANESKTKSHPTDFTVGEAVEEQTTIHVDPGAAVLAKLPNRDFKKTCDQASYAASFTGGCDATVISLASLAEAWQHVDNVTAMPTVKENTNLITIAGLRSLLATDPSDDALQKMFSQKLKQIHQEDYNLMLLSRTDDTISFDMTDTTPLYNLINASRQFDVTKFPLVHASYGKMSGLHLNTIPEDKEEAVELPRWAPAIREGVQLTKRRVQDKPKTVRLSAGMEWVVRRYGVSESDIRLITPETITQITKLTDVQWQVSEAYDPCPYPLPKGHDGLLTSWIDEAKQRNGRVFLHPPYSRISTWMAKAEAECRKGIQILAAIPRTSPWLSSPEALRSVPRYSRWPVVNQSLAHPVLPDEPYVTDLMVILMDPRKVAQ